jgi:hypothetical protein
MVVISALFVFTLSMYDFARLAGKNLPLWNKNRHTASLFAPQTRALLHQKTLAGHPLAPPAAASWGVES